MNMMLRLIIRGVAGVLTIVAHDCVMEMGTSLGLLFLFTYAKSYGEHISDILF